MRSFTKLLGATVLGAAALVGFSSGAQAQEAARIHLIHGIPGVEVDVAAGGSNVFEGFAFGDTQDLSSLAGETLAGVQVKVAGTDTVAIDAGDVALPDSGNYTLIAHLDAEGTPTITVFENDVSAIAAGEGRLVVRHTAAAPAVDVLADGGAAFTNVTNPNEGSVDLPVGTISASVVPTGATEPVVIGPADLTIADGTSLTVYAVGSLADETLTVLTESIDGLGTAPTRINTGDSPIDGSGFPVLPVVAVGLFGLMGAALFNRARNQA